MIRTQQRAYYLEHGRYAANLKDLSITLRAEGSDMSDLDGTYFSEESFSTSGIGDNFVIYCHPWKSNSAYSPKAVGSDMFGIGFLEMDTNGKIITPDISGSGYPEN